MFDELEKYKSNGHFFFDGKDELENVCNAPKNGMGVYVVFALKNGKIEMVYIGSSGKIKQNGMKKIPKGGIFDALVNEEQFNSPRKRSWKEKIEKERIEALDIYWYETFDQKYMDIPSSIEGIIIQRHFDNHGVLPRWNREF